MRADRSPRGSLMSLTEATKPAKQDSRKAKAATAAPPREQILIGPDFIQKGEPHERLDRLFADLASRFDAAPAVISGGRRWSYRELNSRANQFAHLLIERGVKPGDRIGLLLDRSAETYIAVLAVMKAGAAFVPLATAFPEDRMVMIIEDANVTMVISVSGYAARVARLPVPHISIDSAESEIALQPETAPLPEGAQDQTCYILYTSGTTGKPKGVVITHQSFCNFIRVAAASYGYQPGDRVYQGMTIAFDFSSEEIWVPFAAGATVVPAPGQQPLVGEELASFLREHTIT
ncbi:peptide synthetase, partial [Mesorhizobium sp. M00.F.Ca.ET.038.03.1.1]